MPSSEDPFPQSLTALDESHLNTIYSLGYQDYESGHYEEAVPLFLFLTEQRPFSLQYWTALASTYLMLKEYEKAFTCYSFSAILEPNDPYVRLHAADCLFALGKNTEAVEELGRAKAATAEREEFQSLSAQIDLMLRAWSRGEA